MLANNADLKPQDVKEANIPQENVIPQKDGKTQSWEAFSQSVAGLDPKVGLLQNFYTLKKQAGMVSLPKDFDANNYSAYFVGSSNETKVYERDNVMQTNTGFPFSALSANAQKRLMDWKSTNEEMLECIEAIVPVLRKIYMENTKRELGMALHYRIFVQLVARKNPELFTQYLIDSIERMEPLLASRNARYLNFAFWLFQQAEKTSTKYPDLLIMISAYAQTIIDSVIAKKKLDDRTLITWCYNLNLISQFTDQVVAKQSNTDILKIFQATLVDAVYTVARVNGDKIVNSVVKQLFETARHLVEEHIKLSDPALVFETLIVGAVQREVEELPEIPRKFLLQHVALTEQVHQDVVDCLHRPLFEFLHRNPIVAKKLALKVQKNKPAKMEVLEQIEKSVVSPISCCALVWIATFVYIAVVSTAFDGQQFDLVMRYVIGVWKVFAPAFKAVPKWFAHLEKSYPAVK